MFSDFWGAISPGKSLRYARCCGILIICIIGDSKISVYYAAAVNEYVLWFDIFVAYSVTMDICKTACQTSESPVKSLLLLRGRRSPRITDGQKIRSEIFVACNWCKKHTKLPSLGVRPINLNDVRVRLQSFHDVDLVLECRHIDLVMAETGAEDFVSKDLTVACVLDLFDHSARTNTKPVNVSKRKYAAARKIDMSTFDDRGSVYDIRDIDFDKEVDTTAWLGGCHRSAFSSGPAYTTKMLWHMEVAQADLLPPIIRPSIRWERHPSRARSKWSGTIKVRRQSQGARYEGQQRRLGECHKHKTRNSRLRRDEKAT
jgi:hypothetical protein